MITERTYVTQETPPPDSDPAPDSDLVRFVYLYRTEVALLAAHVADHTGHCTGCGSQQPIAPCDLQLAAARVAQLRELRQAPLWPPTQRS